MTWKGTRRDKNGQGGRSGAEALSKRPRLRTTAHVPYGVRTKYTCGLAEVPLMKTQSRTGKETKVNGERGIT